MLYIKLIDVKPFSINSYYYGIKRVRTRDARAWGAEIHRQMVAFKDQIEVFRSLFNPKKHSLRVEIVHEMPKETFFNTKKEVSHRSKDLTNIEKPLIDILTAGKYLDRGFSVLGIDDHFITELLSFKRVSADNRFRILVKFFIIDIIGE